VGKAFQPAGIPISAGQTGGKELSRNHSLVDLYCRGASRNALISDGSRPAPYKRLCSVNELS